MKTPSNSTTLNIRDFPVALHRRMKAAAAIRGLTIGRWMAMAVQPTLEEEERAREEGKRP